MVDADNLRSRSKPELDLIRSHTVETMIAAIRSRPIIWDRFCPDYKNRKKAKEAWKDVCRAVDENYDNLDKKEKQDLEALVLKRWTNVRDRYRKMLSRKTKGTTYIYQEQLTFLDKVFGPETPDDTDPSHGTTGMATTRRICHLSPEGSPAVRSASIAPSPTFPPIPPPPAVLQVPPPPAVPHVPPPPAVPLRCGNETGQFVAERDNPHLSFFKGLLPTIADFSPEEMLDMQMEVLNAIRSIMRRRHNPASHVPHPPLPTRQTYDSPRLRSNQQHSQHQYQRYDPAPMQRCPQPQNRGFDQRLPEVFQTSNMETVLNFKIQEEEDSDFLEEVFEQNS